MTDLGRSLSWYRELERTDAYWVESAKADFALGVERTMQRDQMSKRELAHRLGTSPAYVTKILRGDANLTIESMIKIARAIHGHLHLYVAPESSGVRWFEIISRKETAPSEEIKDIAVRAWAQHRKTGYERITIPA